MWLPRNICLISSMDSIFSIVKSRIPSLITFFALCMGMTSIKIILYSGDVARAVICIIIAMFLDACDGRVARRLSCASTFGANLDSLADLVSFGVAPALIAYVSFLSSTFLGWHVSLIFVSCVAARLARYNSDLVNPDISDAEDIMRKNFFKGVPAPAAAMLFMTPVSFHFLQMVDFLNSDNVFISFCVTIYSLLICFLTLSRIPTFSFKTLKFEQESYPFILFLFLIIITTFLFPWATMIFVAQVYLLMIPFSIKKFDHMKNQILSEEQ